MSGTMIVSIVLLAVVLGGAAITAVVLLMVKSLAGRSGKGWGELAQLYPAAATPEGAGFEHQTIQVGFVVLKNCVKAVVCERGLYLKAVVPFFAKHQPVLIPWPAIVAATETRLHMRRALELAVDDALSGPKIVINGDLMESAKARLRVPVA